MSNQKKYYKTTPLSPKEIANLTINAVAGCLKFGYSIIDMLQAIHNEHGVFVSLGVYKSKIVVKVDMPDGKGKYCVRVNCGKKIARAIAKNLTDYK